MVASSELLILFSALTCHLHTLTRGFRATPKSIGLTLPHRWPFQHKSFVALKSEWIWKRCLAIANERSIQGYLDGTTVFCYKGTQISRFQINQSEGKQIRDEVIFAFLKLNMTPIFALFLKFNISQKRIQSSQIFDMAKNSSFPLPKYSLFGLTFVHLLSSSGPNITWCSLMTAQGYVEPPSFLGRKWEIKQTSISK